MVMRDDRPDPEDDPFACSLCGVYLGTVDRIEGHDYCEGCRRQYGPDEHEPDRRRAGFSPINGKHSRMNCRNPRHKTRSGL